MNQAKKHIRFDVSVILVITQMKVLWFWCVFVGFGVVLCFFSDVGQNPHALFMHFFCIFYALFKGA